MLSKDGVLLVEGVDYRFGYDASNNTIRLTPIAGIWEDNSVYVVRLLDARDSLLRLGAGTSLNDGALTTLLTSNGVIKEFEVESGVRISVNTPVANSVIDGQTITVFDGAFSLSFELNTNTLTAVGTIPVVVNATASAVEIAAALAAAVDASALNLTVNVSGTLIQLLGASSLTTATPVAGTTLYGVSGAVGTRVGFGIGIPTIGTAISGTVQDGQTFAIRRGGNLVRTFEIDFGGGIATPGAIAVFNPANSTLDQFANAIVNAIGGAGLGLAPFNAGQGRIVLGGDANYSLDVSDTTLVQLGVAGQSATIPVVIPIDATVDEVVAAYDAAISNAGLTGVLTSAVGNRLVIEGVAAASGTGAVSLPIIRDEVGNLLQSNGTDGRNVLTIFVGGGFDYGDAPSPYQTQLSAGGPRHRVDRALTLGQSITPEADAILADGDVDDGVALINNAASGFPATFSVEINSADGRAFYLDAWVDWNKNGVFENSEVTRFKSANAAGILAILGVGVNTVSINVPDGVINGQTFARFRLSEVSGLGPNGDADSGEVEDLSILVQSNPYQNPAVASDVNKSGVVTPLDALNVINLLAIYNRNRLPTDPASIPLNPPPAFMNDIVNGRFLPDVNGDGKVSPQDALVVINELARTRRKAAAGEGEQFIPISNGLLASPLTVATSTTTMKRAIAETVEMPSIVDSNPTRMSVFDSPQVVALDNIIDDIADDDRETSSSTASAFDMVFNGLGLGL